MVVLIGVGFLAGLVIGISPCIIPVLPVIVAAGASSEDRRRPFWVVAGLVTSFTLTLLFGLEVLKLLHLPQSLLLHVGIVLLIVLGIGLMIPKVSTFLERPFAGVHTKGPVAGTGSFVFGASLGLVFVPCAGPVLSTIDTIASSHRVGPTVFFMTVAYALGAAIPLLVLGAASQRAVGLFKTLKSHLQAVRIGSGVVMVGAAITIWTGVLNPLQTGVPGYTSALQSAIEKSASVHSRLEALKGHQGAKLGASPGTVGGDP